MARTKTYYSERFFDAFRQKEPKVRLKVKIRTADKQPEELSNEGSAELRRQLRDAKGVLKRAEKKIELLQKEAAVLKKNIKKQDERIKLLKKEHFEYKAAEQLANEATRPLLERIALMEATNAEQVKQLALLSDDTRAKEMKALRERSDKLAADNASLRRSQSDLRAKNKDLEIQLKTSKSIDSVTELKKNLAGYARSYNAVSIELEAYKRKLDEVSKNPLDYREIPTSAIIKVLINRLSYASLDQFERMDTFIKQYTVMKDKRDKLQKKAQVSQILQNAKPLEEGIMGYVIFDVDRWFFHELGEELRYEVIDGHDEDLEHAQPVKAVIERDKARIVNKYSSTTNRKTVAQRRVKVKKNAVKREYEQYPNFNVLVVGSRNKRTYMDRLRAHGFNPVWHDPYEDGDGMLKSKFKTADIVIACKDHINHKATNIMDTGNLKFELLEDDSADKLVNRVRLVAIRLGMLDKQQKSG